MICAQTISLCGPPVNLPRHLVRLLVLAVALIFANAAGGAVGAPLKVTLDGVAGARPGMSTAQVSERWGLRLRPTYEVRPDCGQAFLSRSGLRGYALFTPRHRFAALFLERGAVTGKGIRIGSTFAQLRAVYSRLSSRPSRYVHGGRQYFARRARSPHWELRFDVSPEGRVTQIAFGESAAVRLDEGCA
jgi:hypothetical protein